MTEEIPTFVRIRMIELLKITDVSLSYDPTDLPALDKINLRILEGEIFGLLGPNGAGKTTLMSVLCGILAPDSGTVTYRDQNLIGNIDHFKSKIGVVPQDIALYPTLTARENLLFYGAMYGLKGEELQHRIARWLGVFEMDHAADKLVNQYSGGMKRRVNLIAALLHQPDFLILDEPTVGIDVQSRNAIIEQLTHLNKQGTTILYTSHHLEEAEHFCSNVAIIDSGTIIKTGKPDRLISEQSGTESLEQVFLKLTSKKLRD